MDKFTAVTDAVGGSLALSALVATIPLLTFFIMLLVGHLLGDPRRYLVLPGHRACRTL